MGGSSWRKPTQARGGHAPRLTNHGVMCSIVSFGNVPNLDAEPPNPDWKGAGGGGNAF